ncbi:hypothetical protein F5Y04DRAFT_243761 [Hypomontagnella monticulosa]|nr:hypothetical protein F5Y04DRAFT_243761 [Hypomontagnella monticulosa]
MDDRKSINWWAVIHFLSVCSHFSLFVVGILSYTEYHSYRDVAPDYPYENAAATRSIVVLFATVLGGLAVLIHIIMPITLWKAYDPEKEDFTTHHNRFRNRVIFSIILFFSVFACEVYLVVGSAMSILGEIEATSITAGSFSLLTIVADIFRLKKYIKERKERNYVEVPDQGDDQGDQELVLRRLSVRGKKEPQALVQIPDIE